MQTDMNPLVKKEIRLLLPVFLLGCALALTNIAFRFNPDGSLVGSWFYLAAFGFSGALAVMLALNSFGAEISSGTFSSLWPSRFRVRKFGTQKRRCSQPRLASSGSAGVAAAWPGS